MKKRFSFIAAYCTVFLLGTLGVSVLLLGNHAGGTSETENRTLQGLPDVSFTSVTAGDFSAQTETYLSDQMFSRDSLLSASAAVMGVFSRVSTEEALMQVDIDSLIDNEAGDASNPASGGQPGTDTLAEPESADMTDSSTKNEEDLSDGEPVHAEEAYHTFSLRNAGGGFTRVYAFSEESIAATAYTLNAYRGALPEDGNVFFTYVPYSQVACEWMLHRDDYSGWVSDVEPVLQEQVDPGVYVYSSVNALEPHMLDDEPVYFMTDHHWAPLGAYYMATLMQENAGMPGTSYDDFSYFVYKHFTGSIYAQIKGTTSESLDEELELMYPLAPTHSYRFRMLDQLDKEVRFMEYEKNAYGALLGGTHKPWLQIKTGFHTGRNALVIGDSFLCAFTPYLTPYYDTVCTCDLRKDSFWNSGGATMREYIKHYGIDDVFFVVTTGNGINSAHMKERVLDALG